LSLGDLPFSSVLFDLDNTLLDREEGFDRFCRELYHTSSVISEAHSEEDAVALLKGWDQGGYASTPGVWEQAISQWPGVFKDIDQAMGVLLEMFPALLILDSRTRNMLEDFSDRGIGCGIVTNGGTPMQTAKIEESGLVALVDSYTISGSLGVSKPDPRIFQHALESIEAVAGRTLFVGDNAEHDIVGAKKVGIKGAWMSLDRSWPVAGYEPEYVIDNVWDVRRLVLGEGATE
jgi:putative hydrolase of the HAD superfamily